MNSFAVSCGIGSSGGRCPSLGDLRHGEGTRGWGARRRRVLKLPTLSGVDRPEATNDGTHGGREIGLPLFSSANSAFLWRSSSASDKVWSCRGPVDTPRVDTLRPFLFQILFLTADTARKHRPVIRR